MADQAEKKSKSEPINLSLKRHTIKYLKKLKKSGLHGSTPSTVARTLIQDQIKQLIREGALRMEFAEDDEDEGDDGD